MSKLARPLMLFLCLIFITGCQQAETTSDHKATPSSKKGTESKEEEKLTYSLIGEDMESEPGGSLYQKYIAEKEFAKNNEYAQAELKAIDEYIQNIKNENTKKWGTQQWSESLITAFRTEYKKTLQPMKDFEVKYDKLKLPDGRLLQDVTEKELNQRPDKVNIALLLDASGSMKSNVSGGNKMKLAKLSLDSFAKSLPENVNVSLTVFGHKGTGSDKDKKLSCGNVETVYPLTSYNTANFSNALNKFNASGWTPLASAIEKAEKELLTASNEKTKNFIYVVSDGIETCGGNPVQAAKEAKSSEMDVQINIIGFDVDGEADRQLKEVANAGGGQYTSVKNKQQLNEEVTKSWKERIGSVTWAFWAVGNTSNLAFEQLGMANKLQDLYSKSIDSRNREFERMNNALNKLYEDNLIDSNTKRAIDDILFKRIDNMREYADKVERTKHQEIIDTGKRLQQIVDELTKNLKF
ncbi:VWA domain-containing protein [Bacillus sp. FJAT-49736]|uniref:vWA domain-containing protein n=1 Tax=Bacillus sp. FJAT-49736 TaxID=2833582 RepID=UPI001BCA1D7E|nr:VWA domain-containing protein [Bacillus sp. FJAT-49736]MBS4174897.1 VWA domain-containing protein [Bacillus sp. FJAT-49736]